MRSKHNTNPVYRPKKVVDPYQPDFSIEKDFDFTNPYPCGVCGREFRSRFDLANHSHPKRSTA